MTREKITPEAQDALLKVSLDVIEEEGGQVTLRHLFYRLVSLGLLPKTESAYRRVASYTKTWRRAGMMPYTALTDSSRYYHGSMRYDSPEEAMMNALHNYRGDIWSGLDAHVEVWTEKDAMVDILVSAADPLGVKVFSTRGYASISSVANTAVPNLRYYLDNDKKVYIFYLGDLDPSGEDISRSAEAAIKQHLGGVHFRRIAILPDDIEKYDLLTRPTKSSDPRSAGFAGESVELDAMDMRVVKQRVHDAILNVGGIDRLARAIHAEEKDRARCSAYVNGLASGQRIALTDGGE